MRLLAAIAFLLALTASAAWAQGDPWDITAQPDLTPLGGDLGGGSVYAPPVFSGNAPDTILAKFESITDGWWEVLEGKARDIFKLTLLLDVVLFGIRVAFQSEDVSDIFKQFIMLLLFAGFILAVIDNYEAWAKSIALDGLGGLNAALPSGAKVNPGQPGAAAAKFVWNILKVIGESGMGLLSLDFGVFFNGLLLILSMVFIAVIFLLMSAVFILAKCEFYIVANLGVLLIGLAGSRIFKEYAVNVMRYVLSMGLKLFVIQLVLNIGFSLIEIPDFGGDAGVDLKNINFSDTFFLIGVSFILLILSLRLPETCAGLLNGAVVGGGNPLSGMARLLGARAGGFAVAAAINAPAALWAARTVAQSQGATGVVGTARGMVRAFGQAHASAQSAKWDRNAFSTVNNLRSLASQAKAPKMPPEGV